MGYLGLLGPIEEVITTERLILRPWKESDLEPYAAINADPQVREFFPTLLTREQSDAEVSRFQQRYAREGFCLFAAELTPQQEFIGFTGIQTMSFVFPGFDQPAIEIGWRLASQHWGKGLATEGAQAILHHAFTRLKLPEVIAITVPANIRSRRVMEKIGMVHLPERDFAHPSIPPDHPFSRHVLYAGRPPCIGLEQPRNVVLR